MASSPANSNIPTFLQDAFEYSLQTGNVIITAVVIPIAILLISITSTDTWLGMTAKAWGIVTLIPCIAGSIVLTVKTAKKETSKTATLTEVQKAHRLTSEKLKDLEGENERMKADYEELVNDQLGLIFHRMRLSPKERITVYKHDAESRQFLVLGRYSADPEFSKRSRYSYPDSQGFIMQGWRSDEFTHSNLPDPALKQGRTYYDAVNRISPIPKAVVEKIRMKSRCFYVRRILNPAGHAPVAVVVVESLNPTGLDTAMMRSWFTEEVARLFSFVQRVGTSSVQANSYLAEALGL